MKRQNLSAAQEQTLVQRALDHDLNAFNELVLAYQNLAYSVAYRMLQDEPAASDAVQESFIKAYRALTSFKGGSFKSWLMRIVINSCYDAIRVRTRHAVDHLDDLPVEAEFAAALVDHAESPEAYAERMELSLHIEQGLAALPPDQRLVLVLCDIHGYPYEEIADMTSQPIGTVKSRISRGRAKLREHLLRAPELLPATFRPNLG